MNKVVKKSIVKDTYTVKALLDCVGMLVVGYLLFKMFAWHSLIIILPMTLYYVVTSVFLSFFRGILVLYYNEEVDNAEKLAFRIIKVQAMIMLKGRSLHKKYLVLLQKTLANRLEALQHLENAIDTLVSVRPACVEKTGEWVDKAYVTQKRKVFLENK